MNAILKINQSDPSNWSRGGRRRAVSPWLPRAPAAAAPNLVGPGCADYAAMHSDGPAR